MTHQHTIPGRKRLLVADIGGTHSRFALFDVAVQDDTAAMAASLSLVRKVVFSTRECTSATDMMRTLALQTGEDGGYFSPQSPTPVTVDFAAFGIPGPAGVAAPAITPPPGEVAHCPNVRWPLPHDEFTAALGGAPLRLINDFVSQGFAAGYLPELLDAEPVISGDAREGFPKAVIGAGTGIGHCLVLPGDEAGVVGSEAGHCLFPFVGEEERAYEIFLEKRLGSRGVIRDHAVTGSGLAALYAYHTGEELAHLHDAPAAVREHPVCLAWMARFYGRACRDYALATLPLGGIYIAGGLAANLPEVLTHPAFAEEFHNDSAMCHVLERIPVWHMRNTDTGLAGSAVFAALALRACLRGAR